MRAKWLLRCLAFVFLASGCTKGETDPTILNPDQARQGYTTDFKIVASYGTGYRPPKGWSTTILGNGEVVQNASSTKCKSNLAEAEIKELFRIVHEAQFFSLKDKYKSGVTHSDTLFLEITTNGVTKQVKVPGGYLLGNNDVKRFLTIWDKIVEKVPAPKLD